MNYEITDIQIEDFIKCPIYYNFRHNNKNFSINKKSSYKDLVLKVAYAFCTHLIDGEILSEEQIKKKWNFICKQHRDELSDKQVIEGFSLLMMFYKWAAQTRLTVIDTKMAFCTVFHLAGDSLEIRGEIGIITANKNQQMEELIINFSNNAPDQTILDKSLRITMDHVAFYSTYKQQLIGTKVIHVKTGKEYYTIRDPESESKRLAKIGYNIAKAIKSNIWYPHESALCSKTCEVKDFCRMWGTEAFG